MVSSETRMHRAARRALGAGALFTTALLVSAAPAMAQTYGPAPIVTPGGGASGSGPSAGAPGATATDATPQRVEVLAETLEAPATVGGTGHPVAAIETDGPAGGLPLTGGDVLGLAGLGAAAVAVGTVLTVGVRRRRGTSPSPA